MSININVGGMNYNGLSCLQRAEIDKKRKNRLAQVRQQSKEIAQQVRVKVQCEKENQLKKIQEIKKREMEEWKKRRQCEIQQEYGNCLTNFGAAHIAACETSCEEDESRFQKREEHDLLAAQRGRSAMLQEQRKRDREAEERLMKKKRKQQRNASVQADLKEVRSKNIDSVMVSDEDEDESAGVRVETFTNKPNMHKSSAANYNPKNFTSNSIDSSNNCDSEDGSSCAEIESDVEFNQITNLLKQKCFEKYNEDPVKVPEEPIELSDSSYEEDEPLHPPKPTPVKSKQKSILKKTQPVKMQKNNVKEVPRTKKVEQSKLDNDRVKYVDFGNHYTTSYLPDDDLVTFNNKISKRNATTEAKKHERIGVMNDEVLRELANIRSKEALEKEKTRRDYERLRLELDEVSKQEKEAKEAAGKALRNIPSARLDKQEQIRKNLMNQAVEDTLRRNIITCPPVDKIKAKKTSEVNVAAAGSRFGPTSSNEGSLHNVAQPNKAKIHNDEINNMVKVERLKDLLERINHQKKLLLREIEKSNDIPGPDLEKVMQCLDKLEKEKAAVDVQPDKKQELEGLMARELKLDEREKRFQDRVKELYNSQKKFIAKQSEKNEIESSETSEEGFKVQPVEIIIKVQQPKSPRTRQRKTIRCVDKLSREPGRAYPKTPKKKTKAVEVEADVLEVPKKPEPVKVQQQTQTSPVLSEVPPKPILKKPQDPQQVRDNSRKSDDSSQSISTTYQSLPERIVAAPTINSELLRKPHQKLNPALMHYITRLLGMNKNIGNQLSVSASSVSTPGTSTINSSGNNGSSPDAQATCFDQKRLEKLQEFINDNYSFLSEINETLDRSQLQEQTEDNITKIDIIWRDVLRNKKVQQSPPKSKPSGSRSKVQQANAAPLQSQPTQNVVSNAPPPNKRSLGIPPSQSSSRLTQQTNQRQNISQQTDKQPQAERRNAATVSGQKASASHATTSRTQTQVPGSRPPTARREITNRDMINVTKHLESHMLNNFAEYTANCQKRIGDLAMMMERVRQEKLKLIENSLSSGEFGHFTEYREIVVPGKTQDAPTTSASDLKDSPSQREDPPSEEINNILQKQTRPFGVSKDSGISMLSRPVTSSDFRDSPDVRVTSEERENTFQPILKDIPKPPRVKVTQADGELSEATKDVSMSKEQEEKAQKKLKPPLSLNRFSPHNEKPHEAHELSTIAEVETPSASKVNLLDKIEELGMEGIESFPGFDEYVETIQEPAGVPISPSFPDLAELKDALDELKLKSFLKPEDYGIPEISREKDMSSSDSTIADIIVELKRRDIFGRSFVDLSENENTTPQNTEQIEDPRSPKRKPAQSRIIIRTPELDIQIQRETVRTPTKKRPQTEVAPRPESPTSNDTLSGIQEIEKEPKDDLGIDLQKMGLNWAASMFKRDGESKQVENSSSSTSIEKGRSIEIEIDTNKSSAGARSSSTSSTSSTGQPLNLREFLVRELNKRSRAEKSFSDESSLSSQFMRSLLNVSSRNASSSSKSGETTDREKQRTSTPVQTKGSNQLSVPRSGNTNLFIGDSLSTLKASEGEASSSSGKSNESENRKSN